MHNFPLMATMQNKTTTTHQDFLYTPQPYLSFKKCAMINSRKQKVNMNIFSGTFQFVSFDYMSNQTRMVGCDIVKQKRKKRDSPVVTWEVFSLSMYHSCEWQTLIFKWKHVKVDFSFSSPHYGCVILFIIHFFYSFKCVWLFCIYSMYMLRLLCMWCRFFFLYLTLECMYCTYIYFPHMFIIKNKKKQKLKTVRDL